MDSEAPVEQDPADAARHRTRRSVKEQIAERTLKQQKVEELNLQLSSINANIDRLTNEHQATCLPIQSDLSEVEKRIKSALVARTAVDGGDELRRRELLKALTDANRSNGKVKRWMCVVGSE